MSGTHADGGTDAGARPGSTETVDPDGPQDTPQLVPTLPPAAHAGAPAMATMAPPAPPRLPQAPHPSTVPAPDGRTARVGPFEPRPNAWEYTGLHAAHRATSQQLRNGRRPSRPPRPWPLRIVRWGLLLVLAAIVVGAFAGVVIGVRAMLQRDDLPTYDAGRPDFGTVTVRTDETVGGTVRTIEITANADLSQYQGVVDGAFGRVEVVRVPGATYGLGSTEWTRNLSVEAAGEVDRKLGLASVLTFSDIVPEGAREHTTLDSSSDVVIDGRELTELELTVDDFAFRRAAAEAHLAWSRLVRAPSRPDLLSDGVRFILTVDDDGVVWRMDTSSAPGDRFELLSWSPEPFAATLPESFTPLPIEGAGPDVCDAQRRRLEVAAESWLAGEGTPLRYEAEAIPEYLSSYVSEYDVVDGEVVPTAGGACD